MTTASRVVVIGEALVDIVHRASGLVDESPGGSPANVALALGRLGRRPALVTRLGEDDRGCRIRRWLEESDVTVRAVRAPHTSTATAHLDETGAARYEFDLDWDLGSDRGSDLGGEPGERDESREISALVASAGLVHVGSIGAVLEPGAHTVRELVRGARASATITYDPNVRASLVDDPDAARQRVGELIGLADVVKASDEDVAWLHPGRALEEVAREWLGRGPAVVVVTRGPHGALAVTAEGTVAVPAVSVPVVDTVGAGDTFMAALADRLLERGAAGGALRAPGGGIRLDDLEHDLRRCVQAAAVTVSRPGADPPRLAELRAAVG